MELKEIKELIRLVAESGVSEVEVERGDFKVSIKKTEEKTTIIQQVAAPVTHTIEAAPIAQPPNPPPTIAPPPNPPPTNAQPPNKIVPLIRNMNKPTTNTNSNTFFDNISVIFKISN